MVLEYAVQSLESKDYSSYLHESSELKVNAGKHQALFDELGRALTDFAVLLLFKQFQIYQKTPYQVKTFDEGFVVTNSNDDRQFSVTAGKVFECDCDFASSYGLTCRQMMGVHIHTDDAIVDLPSIYHGTLRSWFAILQWRKSR